MSVVASVAFDADTGLAPAVVQDEATGEVLMVGYMSKESLDLSASTGIVHFWSRSRSKLWKKGETSGNVLEIMSMAVDCDGDAILVQARPRGPTCHTGERSCFTGAGTGGVRSRLWQTIAERAEVRPRASYTAELVAAGVDRIGRKLVEEATETLLAARDHAGGGDERRVYEEIADLEYHLLVLLAERGLDPAGVDLVLADRARPPGSGQRADS